MQKMKGKEKKLVRGKEQCWIGISADCIRRMKESRLAAMIRSHTRFLSRPVPHGIPQTAPPSPHQHKLPKKKHSSLSLSLSLAHRDSAFY